MSFYTIIQLCLVCLMGAMSPGPSVALIINNTITKNRLNGIVTSIGHGLGVTIYALFAVLGLEILITNYYKIFIMFQLIGSFVLIYIGIQTIINANESVDIFNNDKISSTNSFLQGFFIAFFNPKILVFFAALFSQFIYINAKVFDQTILILVPGIIDTLWYILVSIIVSLYTVNNFIYKYKKNVERITGAVLIIVALTLLINLI